MQLLLGLPIPVFFLEPALPRLLDECLMELAANSRLLQANDSELGYFDISLYDSPSVHPLIGRYWKNPGALVEYRLLAVSVEAQLYIDRLAAEYRESEDAGIRRGAESLALDVAVSEFEMHVNNLLLLANLLRPGSIDADKGFAVHGEKLFRETAPFVAHRLYEAVQASNIASWPPFHTVALRDAWAWLERSRCTSKGVGVGPLGRAWAALSHVTTDSLFSSSSIDLVWALVGLEALYAKGNVGLKEQLVAKTEVILGPRQRNKKDFGAIYDYRSRLLHGDLDLPLRYTPYDAAFGYQKFDDELARHEALALAVLIATLQLMASRSWTELEFNYVVSGRSLAPPG